MRVGVVASLLFLAAGPALAQTGKPLLPGIGAEDGRAPVDITQAPWNALVRVQTNLGGRCTGALVAPRLVLTAAHCLHNARTRALLQAGSLHVLLGYARGEYAAHRLVARYVTGQGYDGTRPGDSLGSDWAVLTLAEAAPDGVPVLPVAAALPAVGTRVAVAGYSQDRAQILTADRDCSVVALGRMGQTPMLRHDCSATRGTSGGPLLTLRDGRWTVIGISVAAAAGSNIAVGAEAFAAATATPETGAAPPR